MQARANLRRRAELALIVCAVRDQPTGFTKRAKRILDRVRTLVLDWALNLEKTGIMGTEDNFDRAEKERAQATATTRNIGDIGSLVGNLGHGKLREELGLYWLMPEVRFHRGPDSWTRVRPSTSFEYRGFCNGLG
jgi:hypothetical protein